MNVRAARLIKHGEPLQVQEVQLSPEPGEDEALVRLAFGGVNPVDRYGAEGRVAADGPLPRTLGAEASGHLDGRPVIVVDEGLGTTRDGVWAEAVIAPRASILELPDDVDLRAAAAMGVVGLTAFNVVRLAGVGSDDRVLVLGASGGVGSAIVSLVRATGATVWGQTGSAEKTSFVSEQGPDRVIVASPEDILEQIRELEPTVVLDPLAGDFTGPSVEALTVRGRLVVYGTSAGAEVALNLQQLYRKRISLLGYGGLRLTREERRSGLEQALQALARGELKIPIDDVLALEQVNEAFERLAERRVQGKLLLSLGRT
jgi:NADPH:quinone reductase